ncbi:hypothetical protein [Epilithonimonas sp. UC225_85]|uniref:hypothetical protein n=1 Tax=Epilithonimonas sp. UC225_85 TaxID=3350167 RepID=UPI0036D3C4DA
MKISNTVIRKILEDSAMSLRLATVLGIKQVSVEQLAKRESNKLLHIAAVNVYKEFGFTEDEIIEKEDTKAILDTI